MPSGVRQPFPWESGGPCKVDHDLAPREEIPSTETQSAAKLLDTGCGAGSDRGRFGAEGAADWVHRSLQRAGVDTNLSTVRTRVNQARERVRRRKK